MTLLGIDTGSSSVKCAILRDGRVVGKIVHAAFPTRRDGAKVEVEPAALLKAIAAAARQAGPAARKVDLVALSVFSPGWIAIDKAGEALTPVVTHQDRRSVNVAHALEEKVGKDRYLKLAGNRPFPGGISSTTWGWYLANEPARMRKADLVGHLNTFLHRRFTGARVIDPANAAFMGIYSTATLGGWSEELCEAVGAKPAQLPEIRDADEVGGTLTPEAARELGLTAGVPMTVGVVDGSAAMLAAGARKGQLLNVVGSTDVLALCTDRARPHERLLTRPLGIGRLWVSVSTIAAAGAAVTWAKEQLFPDLDWPKFKKLCADLARAGGAAKDRAGATRKPADIASGGVKFENYLAGDRMSIDQKQASFIGLTLGSTRQQMLAALLEALAKASAARLELLRHNGIPIRREVIVTGGAQRLDKIFHRDWPGRWSCRAEKEATLRGLAKLTPRGR